MYLARFLAFQSHAEVPERTYRHSRRRVEVIAGPFMGVQGELARIKNGDRLVINAPLLSSSVSVEVDAENVSVL